MTKLTWLLSIAMFEEKDNPGYDALSVDAAAFITRWVHNEWYESSMDEIPEAEEDATEAAEAAEAAEATPAS